MGICCSGRFFSIVTRVGVILDIGIGLKNCTVPVYPRYRVLVDVPLRLQSYILCRHRERIVLNRNLCARPICEGITCLCRNCFYYVDLIVFKLSECIFGFCCPCAAIQIVGHIEACFVLCLIYLITGYLLERFIPICELIVMVFVTRFGRCFTGISLRHRVVCNIGLCLKNFIVPVYPRYRVRLRLPNRIEIVIAVSVNKNFGVRLIFNITIRRGCPAEEFVACGFGEADIVIRSYGCGRILRVTAVYKGLRAAALEIIMIRNLHGLGLIGVDCPQRGVLCDGNLIARVDERAVFHFPSEEVFGSFRRKYAGGAAAYILLVIRCYVFVLVLNVCDREAILCGGEERRNRNGAVKLGIYIEQRAVGIDPSGGLFFCEFLVKQLFKLFRI